MEEIQGLNTLNEDKFSSLIEEVLSFIAGESDAEKLKETISNFCKQDSSLSQQSIIRAVSSLVLFFREGVKTHLNVSGLKEELVNKGLLENYASTVASKWKQKFVELSRATAATQTLMVNQLVDIEWKFGVTASNNDLSKAGTTFLQLKLVLDKGDETTENAHMELSLSQFYQFLHELQKAKSNLDYFNV